MKKIAVMQPYFFPYLPYWQLMDAVDKYVVYDDVNYIKGGWINRNRILINGKPSFFNLPLIGASPNKLINEICCDLNDVKRNKMLRTLEMAYGRAPCFNVFMPIMEKIISYESKTIVPFLVNSFLVIKDYLGISTELILSSTIPKNNELKGQDKILSICEILGATDYYNAIGGLSMYSFDDFQQRGISLKFLESSPVIYRQFNNEFQPNLSIIDMLMFCDVEEVKNFLSNYRLI